MVAVPVFEVEEPVVDVVPLFPIVSVWWILDVELLLFPPNVLFVSFPPILFSVVEVVEPGVFSGSLLFPQAVVKIDATANKAGTIIHVNFFISSVFFVYILIY